MSSDTTPPTTHATVSTTSITFKIVRVDVSPSRTVSIEAERSMTVTELKKELYRLEDIAPENQRLMHLGSTMRDEWTLEQSGVRDGDEIHNIRQMWG